MAVLNKTEGIGYAHGKVILGGEHSVVYGLPAIALPIPLNVCARTFYTGDVLTIKSKRWEGTVDSHPEALDGCFHMVGYLLATLNIGIEASKLMVIIDSELPIASGLGSSAAVANAVADSLLNYYDVPMEARAELIRSGVEIAETYAHGKPSGIDMFGTSSQSPIYFQLVDGVSKVVLMNPLSEFHFVIGLSGTTASTKDVVGMVAQRFGQRQQEKNRLMTAMGETVERMSRFYYDGDAISLGKSMTDNHRLLRTLGVSSPALERLVYHAMRAGALGAKLSGKGIGGAVLALAENRSKSKFIANELSIAGASRVLAFSV